MEDTIKLSKSNLLRLKIVTDTGEDTKQELLFDLEDKVVFLFHLEDRIKRYEVYNYENSEVFALCEKLCECKFESIRAMLVGNYFYKKVLEQ